MRARTGLFAEHDGVAMPEIECRLTVPAHEAIERHHPDNRVHGEGMLARVTLAAPPPGLVVTFAPLNPHNERGAWVPAVRTHEEPPWPLESEAAWQDVGEWVPCPACGASLVWYEAGYVPGYRVCSRAPHHHCQLANDGRTARLVKG